MLAVAAVVSFLCVALLATRPCRELVLAMQTDFGCNMEATFCMARAQFAYENSWFKNTLYTGEEIGRCATYCFRNYTGRQAIYGLATDVLHEKFCA